MKCQVMVKCVGGINDSNTAHIITPAVTTLHWHTPTTRKPVYKPPKKWRLSARPGTWLRRDAGGSSPFIRTYVYGLRSGDSELTAMDQTCRARPPRPGPARKGQPRCTALPRAPPSHLRRPGASGRRRSRGALPVRTSSIDAYTSSASLSSKPENSA